MGTFFKRLAAAGAILLVLGAAGLAAPQPPAKVETCADVRAYVATDQSMSMEAFKAMLKAAGLNMDARASASLDGYCDATSKVQNVVITQRVLDLPGGGQARMNAKIVMQDGQCRLTTINLAGC